jgi:hypothetical protein
MDRDVARAALEGMDAAKRELARTAANCPPWRHAAFGLMMAMLVGGLGFGPAIQMPLVALAMAAVALLVADDRRRYGLFVNGYRRGRTLPVTLALLGAMIVLGAAEIHARIADLSPATKLGIAAIAFVIAVIASVAFARVYRRELEGDA